MDVRAIVILGGAGDAAEKLAGAPLAGFDVLGRSVLLRVLDRLRVAGVTTATVVSEHGTQLPSLPDHVDLATATQPWWQAATRSFLELAGGASAIIIVRLGAYVEINYENLLCTHARQSLPVTAVIDPEGSIMGVFVVGSTAQKEASYLFRHQLKTLRQPHSLYVFAGYSNLLRSAADLRRLAIDAFCGNANLAPDADEKRPGIWVAPGAAIHSRARIVAPAFVGAHAKVCTAAVVSRCTVLEHHAYIGPGTIVDNATVLPYTKIGAALDVAHAVVGLKRLAHLGRNIEIEIADPKLIGSISTAPVRVLEHLAALAAYLPVQFLRGISALNGNGSVARLPSAVQSPYPALAVEEESPVDLAGARQYGDD